MAQLVTLAQAKAHLYVTHSSDDSLITDYLMAASEAVIAYLKEAGAATFLDSSGEVVMTTDSPPESTVPRVVQQATLIMVGWFYNNREGENDKMTPGYLPAPVVSLLYPLRTPTLA